MHDTIATTRRANLIGSMFMVGSMGGFAVEDAFLKAASHSLPVSQLMVLFGLGGALIFAALAWQRGQHLLTRDAFSPAMRIRFCFEIIGRLFYVLAIALIPLSTATVILQATPLVVVAAAALLFGENVGWRRWTAIALGLLGVIIIVQPGQESFSALSLLAVIGMLGFAGRDLASHVAPTSLGTAVFGVYGFLAIMIAGALYGLWEGRAPVLPSLPVWLFLSGAVVAGVLGYSCLMKAMRTGEVAAVTPFRYSRLLFGIALGLIFFGENLTPAMAAGSALIVASGLFILWRSNAVETQSTN